MEAREARIGGDGETDDRRATKKEVCISKLKRREDEEKRDDEIARVSASVRSVFLSPSLSLSLLLSGCVPSRQLRAPRERKLILDERTAIKLPRDAVIM